MGLLAPVTGATGGADRNAIRSALSLLFSPGEYRELRSPGIEIYRTRWKVVSGDDLDTATEAACWLSDGPVYWSLNPIQADAVTASKGTVTRRAWFLIDLDTVRPKDVSATEAEKCRSYSVAADIVTYLELAGWPEPVFVDSGNGHHLLYAIDLPNTPLSHQICKAALGALSARFSTEHVKVDTAVHDAPRISRLPGTWNRKGEDTPERPHRLATIVCSPLAIHRVPVELLQALTAKPAEKVKGKPLAPVSVSRGLGKYVETAVNRECERVSLAPEGTRNASLNRAAFSLATLASWPEMDWGTTRDTLHRVGTQAGLSEDETAKTIQSGWEAGKAEPRKRPEGHDEPAYKSIPAGETVLQWADKVVPKSVEWLWPGRIPLGKLTTFAGQGGLGKTFVLCDIAARISQGDEWPLSGGECAEQGKVLFISAEDDVDDTLVPRLIECKANLSQIAFLTEKAQTGFTLAALDLLTRAIDEMSGVRLVVIDPPTSFLDGIDDHKNGELRSVLGPYKDWCARRRIAVIMNTHVNKSTGKDVDAASRVMGSVAWVNAVRTAHLFMREEDEPEKVVFAPIKTNVGKLPTALTYKIESTTGDLAKVTWIEAQDKSADQIISGKGKSKGAACALWLTGMFRMQRIWKSGDIKRLCIEAGYKTGMLFESKECLALPIRKTKVCGANGDAYHEWAANPGWPETESSESCDVNP